MATLTASLINQTGTKNKLTQTKNFILKTEHNLPLNFTQAWLTPKWNNWYFKNSRLVKHFFIGNVLNWTSCIEKMIWIGIQRQHFIIILEVESRNSQKIIMLIIGKMILFFPHCQQQHLHVHICYIYSCLTLVT